MVITAGVTHTSDTVQEPWGQARLLGRCSGSVKRSAVSLVLSSNGKEEGIAMEIGFTSLAHGIPYQYLISDAPRVLGR